jgi:Mn-containing catalase
MDNEKINQLATDLGLASARSNMYDLVADLEKNIAAEAEARQDYYILLEYWYDDLTNEEIEQIKEIIAEELKHTEILRDMIVKRTHILAEE